MTPSSGAMARGFWPPSWLSRTLAGGAVVAGVLAIVIASRFGVGYGIGAAAIGAGVTFPIARRLHCSPILSAPPRSRAFAPLAVVVILGSAALVAMSFRSYGRPWPVFVLAFVLALATAAAVARAVRTPWANYALPLVVTFVCALLLSRLWVFELVGGDPFFHRSVIDQIAASGSTASVPGVYATYPLVLLGAGLLVSTFGISADAALTIYTLVPFLAAVVLTYEIGVRIHGRAVGLWAALLLGVSRWYLYWGATDTPMETAFALFVLGVLCLVNYYRQPTARTASLIVLIIIVSAFLHPFSSLALGAAFVAFAGGAWLHSKAFDRTQVSRSRTPQMSGLVLLAAVVPVAVWIYHGTAFDSIIGAIAKAMDAFEGALVVNTSRSATAYELDRLSDNILFGFAGLACLLLLDRRVQHRSSRAFLQISLLFLICAALGVGADVLGLVGLLNFRWFLFATPMAALLVAWLLAELQRRISRRVTLHAVALTVAGFAFIGVSNGSVNQDSPWYGQKDTLRNDVTADDLSMRSYLEGVAGVRMASDWAMYVALRFERLATGSSVVEYLKSTWPPGSGTWYELVALREADYERALQLPQPVVRQWWLVGAGRFARIYDNGTAEAWLRTNGVGPQ